VPQWMNDTFDVWYRDPHEVVKNMLANADYKDEMDYAPFREFSSEGDEQQWQDFMSGSWAWSQADELANDPNTHGATFVPIVLGSNKTTVSVGTGNNEYYPLYVSFGNVRNNVRCAHRDAVSVTAFLAIPKTTKEHANDSSFRKFRRQLFHSSLAKILSTFKPWMTKPEIVWFGDGYHLLRYAGYPYLFLFLPSSSVSLRTLTHHWLNPITILSNHSRLPSLSYGRLYIPLPSISF
ncbi:hypothetical protein PAXINDRAFT_91248, partial [Paxillus involutus ATCC 200175]